MTFSDSLPRRRFDDTELLYCQQAWEDLSRGLVLSEMPSHLVDWLFAWGRYDAERVERDDSFRAVQRLAHYHGFMSNQEGVPAQPQ